MKRIPIVILFLVFSLFSSLFGQDHDVVIAGRVTDSLSGEPIPNVAVFVPFTSLGTTTDANGDYKLDRIPRGDVLISMRHIAYQAKAKSFFPGVNDTIRFDAELTPAMVQITEVTKEVSQVDRLFGVILFNEMVLGDSYQSSCKLLNAKDLDFYRDGDIITGFSRKPLQIANNYLGYDITYYLDYFSFDRNRNEDGEYTSTEYFTYGGLALFKDKQLNRRVKRTKWEKNRKAQYQGSLQQFLMDLCRVGKPEWNFYFRSIIPDGPDSIFVWDREQLSGHYIRFDRNRIFPAGDSILSDGPVSGSRILKLTEPVLVFFNYLDTPDPIDDRVYYLDLPDGWLIIRKDGDSWSTEGNINWVSLDSRRKLREMLPLDYQPEEK
jgi:hypothetical protein